ncbi:MAG: hypothetical protein E6J00_03875 [Chloroflexi bacterium]|nr:MAG: hypothetical protein E6J00_03875 [Chloroflexota bacterium]
MKRLFSALLCCLAAALSGVGASASAERPATPTPCYGATVQSEVDLNNQTEIDGNQDGDTNEVVLKLTANASGDQPYCWYSYTETATFYDPSPSDSTLSGTLHIWVCGAYQGDFSRSFVNFYNVTYTTPNEWPYWNSNGPCGKQADDLNTTLTTQHTFWFTVNYRAAGYVSF